MFAGCVTVMAIVGCSTVVQVQGGASGTEVSACVVSGMVFDSLERPLGGSLVRLRPSNYIKGQIGAFIRDLYSGSEGRFTIDSVPSGHYCVECIFADTLGQLLECVIDSGDSFELLPGAVVRSMALVSGRGLGPRPDRGTPMVYAIGSEHAAVVDSYGYFQMRVPPGWCRLAFHDFDSTGNNGDTLLYLQPGQSLNVMPPPNLPPQCDSLSCELQIVRGLLDYNGLLYVPVDSVAVVVMNHVEELHLRGRGLRMLPPTLTLLSHLKVLDIGMNFLADLPPDINRLKNLNTLLADNDGLWRVPPSIGMLDSLRSLNLQFNSLQSLPQPITYLKPTVLLKLGGNMLCNLGAATIEWANLYDAGWQSKQMCQK